MPTHVINRNPRYPSLPVADHFGRDPVVISGGVKRLEERLWVDRGFSHRVEILEKNLIRNKKFVKVN